VGKKGGKGESRIVGQGERRRKTFATRDRLTEKSISVGVFVEERNVLIIFPLKEEGSADECAQGETNKER